MPDKFFCCIPLNVGAHIIGFIQWIGVALAIYFIVAYNMAYYVSPYPYEVPTLLAVGYLIPALTWLVTLCSKRSSDAKSAFAITYFVAHFIVEAYSITMPLLRLSKYWSDPTKVFTFNVSIKDTQSQLTVREYLILNSAVYLFFIMVNIYVTCCLASNTKRA